MESGCAAVKFTVISKFLVLSASNMSSSRKICVKKVRKICVKIVSRKQCQERLV